MNPPRTGGMGARGAFTLLEVMVAVAILAGSLLVLVHSQATAVKMTAETDRILVASMLAREKMAQVQILVEREGFGEQDIEEAGDFSDFGDDEDLSLQLDLDDEYEDFRYAWTVRKVEMDLGADLGSLTDDLAASGFWGEQSTESGSTGSSSTTVTGTEESSSGTPGLEDMGFSMDLLTEMLGNYIREVRVLVWWGDNEDGTDQIELVSHVINPSGTIVPGSSTGTVSQ